MERVKQEALAKLSTEERKLLGISVDRRTGKLKKKPVYDEEYDEDEGDCDERTSP